jgi:anti-anti-sigma factor
MDGGYTETRRLDGIWIVAVYGELDLWNVAGLYLELDAAITAASAVIVDLTDAAFIDSTTLKALLRSCEAADAVCVRFAVVVPEAGSIRRLVDLVALSEEMSIYTTCAAAVAAAASRDVEDARASA